MGTDELGTGLLYSCPSCHLTSKVKALKGTMILWHIHVSHCFVVT